ncbi:MAG: hypothetical protein OXF85_00210, partial [Candidatus Saccharibacteria bacterium]|nr:hypothetical protein [Candidatus Saccharibacteria bacterium]
MMSRKFLTPLSLSVFLIVFCGLLLALGLINVSAQATPTVTMTLSSSSNEGNSGFTDVTVTLDYADL